jgi:hypothetical protein
MPDVSDDAASRPALDADDAPAGGASGGGASGGRRVPTWAIVLLVLGGLAAAGVWAWWASGPPEATVRRAVVTTLQAEAPASFLVTGTVTITAEVTIRRTESVWPTFFGWVRRVNPDFPAFDQGTATATVRAPGRVSYGFDVRRLGADSIAVDGQTVAVTLPPLRVHSVEPDLAELEVKTGTTGWMQLVTSEAEAVARRDALAGLSDALRRQAEQHLADATQPRVNTARALDALLTPPLEAAGLDDPQLRFRLGSGLVLRPDS